MSTSTNSWLWYINAKLSGYDDDSEENLNSSEDDLTIDPASFVDVIWHDADDDGKIEDSDTDDGHGSDNDTVEIDGDMKTVKEMAVFKNSTVDIDGTTHTVDLPVWLFDDGTYAARMNDVDIPHGHHWSQVDDVHLGTFENGEGDDHSHDGEYSFTYTDDDDDPFVCFTTGTLITTDNGDIPIERLQPGDLVQTLDHGLQPIRWIGKRQVSGTRKMAPIVFADGAMGNTGRLCVSPQHRMLVTGWQAQLLFATDQVLVAAKHLINHDTIYQQTTETVDYIHILFDRHEIVFANGCRSESFHPGAQSLTILDQAARAELLTIFPELGAEPKTFGQTARLCLTGRESTVLRPGRILI